MKRSLKGLLIAPILLALAWPANLPGGNKAEGITREQADAILDELRQIRQLLEKLHLQQQGQGAPGQPSEEASMAIHGGYLLGRSDAPLTMVEFTDFQCPYCRQFHQKAFEEIRKNYIETGKVRFISRDFPLDFHESATMAAQAARCAGEQGKFWQMRHLLIANASNLGQEALTNYAQQSQLDMPPFRACLDSQKYLPEIQREIREAEAMGISATPTFLIGKTTKEGVDGVKLVGAQPYAAFDSRFKELLSSKP